MSVRSFFDTNVLVYIDDDNAPAKQQLARDLFREHRRERTGVVSVHVLQEYFVTLTRKLKLEASRARREVELLAEFDVASPRIEDVLAAIDLHRIHGISFWNGLILRSAQHAGCRVLYSEDFQHGRAFDGIRIVNPFQK